MGLQQSKEVTETAPNSPHCPQGRILRGGGEPNWLRNQISTTNDYAAIVETASRIVDPWSTQIRVDLARWICDSISLGKTTPIHGAPKASHIVAADEWTSTIPSRLLGVSTPINTPISGRLNIENYRLPFGICSILFDTDRDGYLSSDDVQEFINVYGLKETTLAPYINRYGRISKDEFEGLLRSKNEIDLFAIRYPFKLLRLVSYCFQHESFSSPSDVSFFMYNIFERTFGKKVTWELGMFGHIGILEYLNRDSRKWDDYDLVSDAEVPVKKLGTLVRIWGLTQDHSKVLIDRTHACRQSCLSFTKLYELHSSFEAKGPQDPSHLFPLLDADNDGFLSPTDIRRFATAFNQELSDEGINLVISSLDFDRDGRLGLEDFRQAMVPLLKETSWEVWLVGIALAIFLVGNPALIS